MTDKQVAFTFDHLRGIVMPLIQLEKFTLDVRQWISNDKQFVEGDQIEILISQFMPQLRHFHCFIQTGNSINKEAFVTLSKRWFLTYKSKSNSLCTHFYTIPWSFEQLEISMLADDDTISICPNVRYLTVDVPCTNLSRRFPNIHTLNVLHECNFSNDDHVEFRQLRHLKTTNINMIPFLPTKHIHTLTLCDKFELLNHPIIYSNVLHLILENRQIYSLNIVNALVKYFPNLRSLKIQLQTNAEYYDCLHVLLNGIPGGGILGLESLWTRQILLNRQTPALHTAFATIYGTENLLVNHDRYGMFRPTKEHPERATITNLHLDMNPWNYIGDNDQSHLAKVFTELRYRSNRDWILENDEAGCAQLGQLYVQGLVNLADNHEEDGGFWLIPGFHQYMTKWTNKNYEFRERFLAHNQFIVFDKNEIPDMYKAACHISMRAGSAVLWDQRMMHGSRANCSLRPRYVQYLKMFRADIPTMTPERAERRRKAILEKLQAVNIDPITDLTAAGRIVFGLVN
ncbi:unnamed protein product [Rotaria sp. Silwood1]|nr:unnamed protein product [Rotaria sp. Silwood1]CAF4663728.1 unnamed protein product [Rotaria sp. Silwood1]CAF4865069.1 unnamed protein product [Rotaria sp. Silwood1]